MYGTLPLQEPGVPAESAKINPYRSWGLLLHQIKWNNWTLRVQQQKNIAVTFGIQLTWVHRWEMQWVNHCRKHHGGYQPLLATTCCMESCCWHELFYGASSSVSFPCCCYCIPPLPQRWIFFMALLSSVSHLSVLHMRAPVPAVLQYRSALPPVPWYCITTYVDM